MTSFLAAAQEPAAAITLAVFAGAIVLFVTGWLAPEVTGLLAAALLVAFGVLKPDEAVQGFGSPALITLMGLFALSAGLFRSGGLDRLRALISSDAVRSPKRMIALMVGVVAPISGFIPNTRWWPPCCRCWRGGAIAVASRHPRCCCPSPSPPCWGAPSLY